MKIYQKTISTLIFLLVFVAPMLIQYRYSGAGLSGDLFARELSYIQSFAEAHTHLVDNYASYLNVYANPIFRFFVAAYLVQSFMGWVERDD